VRFNTVNPVRTRFAHEARSKFRASRAKIENLLVRVPPVAVRTFGWSYVVAFDE